ncbi:S16 family serine protease, partial [Candidatus Poribacteria bacterium]
MSGGLDILRSTWQHKDYEGIRNDYINDFLEELDIEELTLLECASYQYQTEKEFVRRQREPFLLREEAFRSKLRHQRRLEMDTLVRGIRADKQSIYGISSENKGPYFLMECFYRLTWQYEDMYSIPDTFPVKPALLEEIFAALNSVLKAPTQQSQDTVCGMIESLDSDDIKCALKNALSYMLEPALKVDRKATETVIKNLLYEEDQHDEKGRCVKEGRGYIGDLIISIYQGEQEPKIVKSNNIGWDGVVENVKKICFSYADREDEMNNYALSVYVNDYPGTRESKIEHPFWGESIGLGAAIAILAFLKECSVKQGIAYTGNVNGNYHIGAVGGFEGNGKAYAACWSEIGKIIVPEDNVEKAEKEVKKAIRDRARSNTEVVGVAHLSEVEEELFQSFISPKLDEMTISEFPFPIAYRYKQIPLGEDTDKKQLIFQTLIAAMQYLSLIIISQYTIRDADREKVRNRELAAWFCDVLGKKTETWGIAFFKFLRHYLSIYGRSQVELFTKELYDISENQYDVIEKNVTLAMDLHHGATQGNTTRDSSQMLTEKYTKALEMVLEYFPFIGNYHLIRISKKQGQDYFYHNYTGTEPDIEEHKLPHMPEQELIIGQLYLAKPDYSDFLYIHPMLVFWESPTDVLLYHNLEGEKVNYLPRFMPGFLNTPVHFFEIKAIYERLRKEKEKKPSFDELDWVHIRERAKEDSSIGEFDNTTYTKRSDAVGILHQYLDSDKNCLVISGNAGSGKTSLLCNLADELRDDENVCVLVYPAENLRKQSIEEKLSDILVEDYEGVKDEFLKRLNETGKLDGKKLIVCIDAINEHDAPKQLLESLDETVEKRRYLWFKMIITCRTNVWKRIGPPIVRLTEKRYYRHGDNDDMVIYLQDFGTEELPEAYAKYRSKHNLQTAYNDLLPVVKRMVKDPLMLALIAESYSNEEIPTLGFSTNSVYQKYIEK